MSNSVTDGLIEQVTLNDRSFSLLDSLNREMQSETTAERTRRIRSVEAITLQIWERVNRQQETTQGSTSQAIQVQITEQDKSYSAYLEDYTKMSEIFYTI